MASVDPSIKVVTIEVSLRDYFAGQAIVGLIAAAQFTPDKPLALLMNQLGASTYEEGWAKLAYRQADARLAERGRDIELAEVG